MRKKRGILKKDCFGREYYEYVPKKNWKPTKIVKEARPEVDNLFFKF